MSSANQFVIKSEGIATSKKEKRISLNYISLHLQGNQSYTQLSIIATATSLRLVTSKSFVQLTLLQRGVAEINIHVPREL